MKTIDYNEFVDLVTPRLFEVAAYQKLMCGNIENQGKGAQEDVTQTELHGALTYLDQFTQDYILLPIYGRWSDLVPLVEEDTGLKRANLQNECDYSIVMDPIDGTAFFVRGDHDYSIMLGIMKKGEMEVGLICYPEEDTIICAIKNQGAWIQMRDGSKKPLTPLKTMTSNENKLSCHYRLLNEPYLELSSKLINAGYQLSSNDKGFGTNATGILRVARGESCAFIGPHISLHDFSVPTFIVSELGGVFCLYQYEGLNDTNSWSEPLENYGSPSLKGPNPRYRVIISDSLQTISKITSIMMTKP